MKLNEVTPEIKDKMYKAETAEDFLKVAEENGVEVTREEAEKLYQTGSRKLSDDELDVVSGGTCSSYFYIKCRNCGTESWAGDLDRQTRDDGCGEGHYVWKCANCGCWITDQGYVD